MNSIFKAFIEASILLFILASCKSNNNAQFPWELGENTLSVTDNADDILLKFTDGTLTPSGATFIIENNGDEEIAFGQMYAVQIYVKGKWYNIEEYVDWTLELFTLFPNENYSFSADWTQLYGILPLGKYRLIKEFSISHFPIYVACEFTIS
jgi:hypothetical protein